MIVLDCCAAVDMVRETPEGKALALLMLEDEKVISSTLLYAETDHAFSKFLRADLINREQARAGIEASVQLVDEFHDMSENYLEAFAEAARLGHSTYDLFYFTLARRYAATLFTLDRKLMALCEQEGVDCCHLLDLE